jgi:hypothetical protein
VELLGQLVEADAAAGLREALDQEPLSCELIAPNRRLRLPLVRR